MCVEVIIILNTCSLKSLEQGARFGLIVEGAGMC